MARQSKCLSAANCAPAHFPSSCKYEGVRPDSVCWDSNVTLEVIVERGVGEINMEVV